MRINGAPIESLADALTALIHEQRLSYAQIARPGRLTRNTVRLIAIGKTRNPSEHTLVKIGVGLAVSPYTGHLDQEVLAMALRRLGRASGHPDLGQRWAENTIPVLLATVTGSVETATAWVQLIEQFPSLDEEHIRQLATLLARQQPG